MPATTISPATSLTRLVRSATRASAAGLAFMLVAVGVGAQEAATDGRPGPTTRGVIVERDVPVTMRDGVTLSADVYRPDGPGPYPALLMRTPYDKSGEAQSARLAMTEAGVARGYVVVVQDTRGQYESEGFFVPYTQERFDGYDTIEWVASLPYVDGKVGTFGLSYPGAVQWMTAPTAPPHLVAMSPSMTFANHNHFIYYGGVFGVGIMNWLLGRQIRARGELGLPLGSRDELNEAWTERGREWLSYRPIADIPLMEAFPYWAEWANNPIERDYWAPFDIEAQHDRVRVPALNLTGWNDDSYGQPGAIRNFVGMSARGATEQARRGQRLVIGPWTHGQPSMTRTTYRGVDYGPNATMDYVELQLRFFDYWLKGIDDGYSAEAPVRIFVMGDNVWRDEWEWPLARTVYTDLFLRADGRLTDAAGVASDSTDFVYDPTDLPSLPPPGEIGRDDGPASPAGDLLTYVTEPFASDTEITGQILARLWLSSTAPDTDFTVRVYDEAPDGERRRLTADGGRLRARYRSTEEPEPPHPLAAGAATELTISMGYTSYVLPAGHRLRLFVTSSLSNPHPNRWDVDAPLDQAFTAVQTVYVGPEHPSRIVIPVIPR